MNKLKIMKMEKNIYANKIDIWCLGITLYEISSYHNPFEFTNAQIYKNIKNGEYKLNLLMKIILI